MGRFVPNPGFEARLRQSPEVRAVLHRHARGVARQAERLGQSVSRSYKTSVEDTPQGVRVAANTDPLNAASWIEFGSSNNVATAPLRRGAEASGLKTTRRKR